MSKIYNIATSIVDDLLGFNIQERRSIIEDNYYNSFGKFSSKLEEVCDRVEKHLWFPKLESYVNVDANNLNDLMVNENKQKQTHSIKNIISDDLKQKLKKYAPQNKIIHKLYTNIIKKAYLKDNYAYDIELNARNPKGKFEFHNKKTQEKVEITYKAYIAVFITCGNIMNNCEQHYNNSTKSLVEKITRAMQIKGFYTNLYNFLAEFNILDKEQYKLRTKLHKMIGGEVGIRITNKVKLTKVNRLIAKINQLRTCGPLYGRANSSNVLWSPTQPLDLLNKSKRTNIGHTIIPVYDSYKSTFKYLNKAINSKCKVQADAGTMLASIFNKVEVLETKLANDYDQKLVEKLRKKYASLKKIARASRIDVQELIDNERLDSVDKAIIARLDEINSEMRELERANDILCCAVNEEIARIENRIKEVKGKEIISSYQQINYTETAQRRGSLSNSCMKYDNLKVIESYAKNPQCCSLIVVRDGNKTEGRALLWTDIDGNKYIDRIFAPNEEIIQEIRGYCALKGYKTVYSGNTGIEYVRDDVVLRYQLFCKNNMPYLDSMKYINKKSHFMHKQEYATTRPEESRISIGVSNRYVVDYRYITKQGVRGTRADDDMMVQATNGKILRRKLCHKTYNGQYIEQDGTPTCLLVYANPDFMGSTMDDSYRRAIAAADDPNPDLQSISPLYYIYKPHIKRFNVFNKEFFILHKGSIDMFTPMYLFDIAIYQAYKESKLRDWTSITGNNPVKFAAEVINTVKSNEEIQNFVKFIKSKGYNTDDRILYNKLHHSNVSIFDMAMITQGEHDNGPYQVIRSQIAYKIQKDGSAIYIPISNIISLILEFNENQRKTTDKNTGDTNLFSE
jgi:hypothetical protein